VDDFEFVFSLFGLLLGFSLVEVVAGLGRAVEVRVRPARSGEGPRPRIGMLSPLLGLFVIFNLVSFWTAAWSLRGAFPVQYPVLLFGLTVTGGYYFAAMLVFPRDIQEWTDLDDHYFQVKRWVVAVIAVCNALGSAGAVLAGLNPLAGVVAVVLNLLFFGLLAALFFARGRRANLALLVLIAAEYPLASLITALL
jgi:hypothetical protein